MPNYSELMDLFLSFLLPEHAAEIGKFFEHFVLTNMKNLLQKLNLYFNKQPSYLKKIYACLGELSNEKDLNMERLKEKVLPLLKGNQLLIDWFMQLFEKPLEGVQAEFESVYIKKSLSDSESSVDNYEEIHSKDLIECDNVDDLNACGVRYKNGKIMYHGTLLPAKISFLAHDAPSLLSLKKEENPLCSHEIRKHVKFNDPKKIETVSTDEIKKKAKRRKFKLCDAPTLHAHAVRLNSVHAQNGEKLSDFAHLLTPSSGSSIIGDEKNSPKKPKSSKKSPKKTLSNKSPSSSSGNSVNISPPSQSQSKALQTAKKLRNLVEDEEPVKKKAKLMETTEQSIPKIVTTIKAADKQPKRSQKSIDIVDSPSTSKRNETEPKTNGNREKKPETDDSRGTGGWTREEDKLILEEIKVGYTNKEELLDVLLTKLTRSRSEINVRYDFLFDIILMMTKA